MFLLNIFFNHYYQLSAIEIDFDVDALKLNSAWMLNDYSQLIIVYFLSRHKEHYFFMSAYGAAVQHPSTISGERDTVWIVLVAK